MIITNSSTTLITRTTTTTRVINNKINTTTLQSTYIKLATSPPVGLTTTDAATYRLCVELWLERKIDQNMNIVGRPCFTFKREIGAFSSTAEALSS